MVRAALSSLLAVLLLGGLVPSALAAREPLLRPGAWEGTDDDGRIVSFDVDRRNRIVDVGVPGPSFCGGDTTLYLPGWRGEEVRGPVPVRGGRFFRTTDWGTTLRGRVVDGSHVTGVLSAVSERDPSCSYRGRFTARRLTRAAAEPATGAWSGSDASGGKVTFDVRDFYGAVAKLEDVRVATPWNPCTPYPPISGGLYPGFYGSGLFDRSRRTGRVSIDQRFAGPMTIGFGPDGHSYGPGWKKDGMPGYQRDGSMVTTAFDATVVGATASGTWRTVVTGPDGTVRCDSGSRAWEAAPVAGRTRARRRAGR